MVPPNESNTTTDAISGFLQAIRSSSHLVRAAVRET